jgi:hypothetical protein
MRVFLPRSLRTPMTRTRLTIGSTSSLPGTEAFVTFSHKPGIIFHYEVPWGDDPAARKLFVGSLNRGLQGVFQNLADHLGRLADEAGV